MKIDAKARISHGSLRVQHDLFLAARREGGLFISNLRTGEDLSLASGSRFREFAASADGRYVAASIRDGGVVLYDTLNLEVIAHLEDPGDRPAGVSYTGTPSFSFAGDRLAVGYHGTTRIWDWNQNEILEFKGAPGDFQHWPSWITPDVILVHRSGKVVSLLNSDLDVIAKLTHDHPPNIHAWCDPWLVTGGISVWSSDDWTKTGDIPSPSLYLVSNGREVFGGTTDRIEMISPVDLELGVLHEGEVWNRVGICWWDNALWSIEPEGQFVNFTPIPT